MTTWTQQTDSSAPAYTTVNRASNAAFANVSKLGAFPWFDMLNTWAAELRTWAQLGSDPAYTTVNKN